MNTAVIGGLLAIPSLVASWQTRSTTSADWLLRSDKFLAIGRFSELSIPLPAVFVLALTAVLVWRYHRELILPWMLAASGLVLMNHQVVSGLQIENFHWSYVAGPCLSLLIGLLLTGWISDCRPDRAMAVVLIAGLCLVTAGWLRWAEAVRTREVVEILGIYREYRDQTAERSGGTAPGSRRGHRGRGIDGRLGGDSGTSATAGELLGHAQSVGGQ